MIGLQVVDYDGHMNLNLEEVEMVDPSGAHLTFPNFYVQNRLIRLVVKHMRVNLGLYKPEVCSSTKVRTNY